MDIATFTARQGERDSFISSNFSKVEYGLENPLRFYKVNFINRTDSLRFCTMNIKQCWVKKKNDLYEFFMLIKKTEDIEEHIAAVYGPCNASSVITTQGIPIGDGLLFWKKDHLNIYSFTWLRRISKRNGHSLRKTGA